MMNDAVVALRPAIGSAGVVTFGVGTEVLQLSFNFNELWRMEIFVG